MHGYAGLSLEPCVSGCTEVDALRSEIATLMSAAVRVGTEAMTQEQERVVVGGGAQSADRAGTSATTSAACASSSTCSRKTQLMRLLDVSSRAEGVRIYIGGESQVVPYEELSIVSAPYEVNGQVVGTLRRHRPHAHGLRPHDPDRGHHLADGGQALSQR